MYSETKAKAKERISVLRYVGKRLLLMIPVILGISLLVFSMMELSPGDPA